MLMQALTGSGTTVGSRKRTKMPDRLHHHGADNSNPAPRHKPRHHVCPEQNFPAQPRKKYAPGKGLLLIMD